jgi:hypothetical protein
MRNKCLDHSLNRMHGCSFPADIIKLLQGPYQKSWAHLSYIKAKVHVQKQILPWVTRDVLPLSTILPRTIPDAMHAAWGHALRCWRIMSFYRALVRKSMSQLLIIWTWWTALTILFFGHEVKQYAPFGISESHYFSSQWYNGGMLVG